MGTTSRWVRSGQRHVFRRAGTPGHLLLGHKVLQSEFGDDLLGKDEDVRPVQGSGRGYQAHRIGLPLDDQAGRFKVRRLRGRQVAEVPGEILLLMSG